jgi:DnaK suppressor protein
MMQRIDVLRGRLFDRRRELFRHVSQAEDDLLWLDTDVPAELEEEAQETVIAGLLTRLDLRGQEEIAAIDRALLLIARGDYGTCQDCGEEIPIERLEALPTATTCILCAEARENAQRQRAAS